MSMVHDVFTACSIMPDVLFDTETLLCALLMALAPGSLEQLRSGVGVSIGAGVSIGTNNADMSISMSIFVGAGVCTGLRCLCLCCGVLVKCSCLLDDDIPLCARSLRSTASGPTSSAPKRLNRLMLVQENKIWSRTSKTAQSKQMPLFLFNPVVVIKTLHMRVCAIELRTLASSSNLKCCTAIQPTI